MAIGDNVMSVDEQVIGSLASAYVTIEGRRYLMLNLKNFEASYKVITKKKGLLGKTGKVSYPTGWEGNWKATLCYNSPIFREVIDKFAHSGKFPAFEIEVTNENTTGSVGRQTITFRECYIDSGILAKIDVETEDELTEDVSGTFNDFLIPEKFSIMPGVVV